MANIYYPEILEEKYPNSEVKGMFSVSGKNLAVYDYKEPIGGSYYDKNKLTAIDVLNEYDSISKSYSDSHEGWTFVSPYILLEVVNGKLNRIDSYFGK